MEDTPIGKMVLKELQQGAWVTLLTQTSYLPGVILLAFSLVQQKSKYPLIVHTTPSFPENLIPILEKELQLTNGYHLRIQPLEPPESNKPTTLIAERFKDTWTKLRVFEMYSIGFKRLVFLDADMLIMRNMDELFDIKLPEGFIAANHACVCNLDKDAWAPPDWTRENCIYTGLKPLDTCPGVPHINYKAGKRTHRLLNSGLFVFVPTKTIWEKMIKFLHEDERVKTYMFPDQDFLADFFQGKWIGIEWKYNAIKTMRYWHKSMWSDAIVKNIHYIVDKPWAKRIGSDGVAGYLGKDGTTHKMWWIEFDKWLHERVEIEFHDAIWMMMDVVPRLDRSDSGIASAGEDEKVATSGFAADDKHAGIKGVEYEIPNSSPWPATPSSLESFRSQDFKKRAPREKRRQSLLATPDFEAEGGERGDAVSSDDDEEDIPNVRPATTSSRESSLSPDRQKRDPRKKRRQSHPPATPDLEGDNEGGEGDEAVLDTSSPATSDFAADDEESGEEFDAGIRTIAEEADVEMPNPPPPTTPDFEADNEGGEGDEEISNASPPASSDIRADTERGEVESYASPPATPDFETDTGAGLGDEEMSSPTPYIEDEEVSNASPPATSNFGADDEGGEEDL